MKLVPILVITNALALALVAYLYVEQQDLEARVGSTRAGSNRGEVAYASDIDHRIAQLEQMLSVRDGEGYGPQSPVGEVATDETRMPGDELGAPAADGAPVVPPTAEGGEPEGAEYNPAEMETFRRKVRRAGELNRDEDWMNRVGGRLDDLVTGNKISPVTQKQKQKIASTLLELTRQTPNVFRRLRESGALENASREERREIVRAEFDSLRAEAQKSLEGAVPAADAKTILDTVGGDRGMMRGGGGGGPTGRTRGGSR